ERDIVNSSGRQPLRAVAAARAVQCGGEGISGRDTAARITTRLKTHAEVAVYLNRSQASSLPHQHQRIGGIGYAPPLRIVVGLEMPGFAVRRDELQLAALQPPHRRIEGGDRGI